MGCCVEKLKEKNKAHAQSVGLIKEEITSSLQPS
jgi:hypothetical protein